MGVVLAVVAAMTACSQPAEPKAATKPRHAQREQSGASVALDLTAETAVPTLYPLRLPEREAQSIVGIALEGEAAAVRIYAVHRSMLPAQADSLPLYAGSGATAVNPAAAAILAEPTTRLLFYGRRSAVGLQFPMGWGLPLQPEETVMAEVEWQTAGQVRHIQVALADVGLKPLTPWVAEAGNRRALDAPAHMRASATVPAGHQIYWISLIASPGLVPHLLTVNAVAVPLQFGATDLQDFFVPVHGRPAAVSQPVELTCATRASTEISASTDCGVFGYFYQP